MIKVYDAVVIGAGPAGISASARLAEMGLQVLTLDEQQRLGGQIYRNIQESSQKTRDDMGDEYARGIVLAQRFENSGALYYPRATVWDIESDGCVYFSKDHQSEQIRANYIVIATGAMERPVPFPGWNLPGIMGAGAVNNLAKEAELTPDCDVVLAGSGPLLLLEASLLIQKGVNIKAILETTPKTPSIDAMLKVFPALKRFDFLKKGLKMVGDIKKSGTPHHKGITNLRAFGDDKVERVEANNGSTHLQFSTDMLLTHFGVIPNTHIFRLLGCQMAWHREQRYWYPQIDKWGRTNFDHIFAAGDGAGVKGALTAEYRGEIAALEIAHCLGIIPTYERDQLAGPIENELKHDDYPRPFVDAVFAPSFSKESFDDETVLCRCENIKIKDVRKAVGEGVREVNELKIVTRCGMGPCQGRMCGPAMAEVVGAELALSPDQVGVLKIRPPLKPIPLGEIADMEIETAGAGQADLFKNQSK